MSGSAIENGNCLNDSNHRQSSVSKDMRWSSLAKLFREQRLNAGLSADDLVRRLEGVTADQLLSYEAGETPIPLEEIFSLTNALNIPPEEVMAILYDSSSKA